MDEKKLILGTTPIGIVVDVLLASLLVSAISGLVFTQLVFAATDTMDIDFINVFQSDGVDWVLRANFTSSGGSVRISDSQQVRFEVGYKYNKTLAGSEAYAYTNTTVTMNITTGIWNNVALNTTIVTGQSDATYYYLIRQGDWNVTLPVGGTTYTCTFLYRGYY